MIFFSGWTGILEDSEERHLINSIRGDETVKNLRIETSPLITCAISDGITEKNENYFISILGTGQSNKADRSVWKTKIKTILENYEQGKDYLAYFKAGFVLILVDYKRQKLTLAIDPIGQNSLYFAQTSNGLVFGASADIVVRHPNISNEISLQSIYDYVFFHQCPSPDTIYSQVQKLEGGQVLVYQSGEVSLRHYWMPEFTEIMDESVQHKGEQLQQQIIHAVKETADNESITGAFLSGGLDSSTVVGALSKVYPKQAKTFSIGFPVESYNEIEYARIAVDQFETTQHEYFITPEDTVKAIPNIAAYYDEPFGNSSALAAYYCAKMAKENGVKVLLAGDGGDELFAGNERYTKQLLFEKYKSIPPFFRAILKAGLYNAPQFLLKNKILFKGKRYIEQAETPLPDRLEDYNYLIRHSLNEIFVEEFLQQIVTSKPLLSLRDSFNRPKDVNVLNRMLYMDWKTTLHDNDLVKVNKMCEMAGVEVRYPLLHQDIIDLSCKIPSTIKIKGDQLRWFYKQAMIGFLPEKIINKPKHGFGLPFGIWLTDHQPLKELAYDSLNDLKKRHYFHAKFLDHTIKMHQSIHAPYYGELIWILMMLELWFQGKNL